MDRAIEFKLLEWKNKKNKKPLILEGARQVGKTYSIKDFAKKYYKKSHYINFESDRKLTKIFEKDLDVKRIIKELSYYLNESINIKEDLLIFDEIQVCSNALTSLKYFNEDLKELDLICAGSLLGVYLGESSFPVGKVEHLKMYPMNFLEFLNGIGEKSLSEYVENINIDNFKDKMSEIIHEKLWDFLKLYFVVGGLPEVINVFKSFKGNNKEAFEKVRKIQNDLIFSYMADVAKHSGKVNSMHIERVWKSIASQLKNEHNSNAPKFKFNEVKVKNPRFKTLESSIDWLEKTSLVIKCPIVKTSKKPLSAYVKENSFKLFIFDIGILGAISNLSPLDLMTYDYGSYKGYFAENFIAEELFSYDLKNIYNWTKNTSEIEFLLEKDDKIIPLEVKSGWITNAKSLDVYREKYSPDLAVILSAKNFSKKNNTVNVPLYASSVLKKV